MNKVHVSRINAGGSVCYPLYYIMALLSISFLSLPAPLYAGLGNYDTWYLGDPISHVKIPEKGRCVDCTDEKRSPQNTTREQEIVPAPSLEDLKNRFGFIINGLRRFMTNEPELFEDVSLITNMDQLNQRVDRFYISATYERRYLMWRSKKNKEAFTEYPEYITSAQAKKSALERELPITQRDRIAAEKARDREVERAKTEERIAKNIWNKGDLTSQRLLYMQMDVRDSIAVLIPQGKERDAFQDAFGDKFKEDHVFDEFKEYQPPIQVVPMVRAVKGEAVNMIPWAFPPVVAPTGSIKDKLDSIGALTEPILFWEQEILGQEKILIPLGEKVSELREGNYALETKISDNKEVTYKANALAEEARDRIYFAKKNQNKYATDALTFAATAAVWNHVRTTIVMPQLERFLKATGLLKGMRVGDAIRRIGADPQELIRTTGRLKNWQTMINVQKKVLELPEYFAASASAVAEAMGNPQSDDYTEVLKKDIFSGLDQREVSIMNTVADSMRKTPGVEDPSKNKVGLIKIIEKWMKGAKVE